MTNAGKRILHSAEHSAAAEAIAGHEDLLREILLRLPIESLLRFSYARRHNPNNEPSGLLLNHDCTDFQFVPFNNDGDGDHSKVSLSHPIGRRVKILQSCNGLLLCSSTSFTSSTAKNRGFQYNICNPTTKQFTTLRFPTPEFKTSLIAVNLAFDLLKSPHYKLICIWDVNSDSPTYQIDVYSSETCSLKPPASGENPLTFTAPPGIVFRRPIYCNGAIHWLSEGKTSLYFDAHTERLKTMPMPPFHEGFDFDYNVRYFGESRGHLHLIVTDEPFIMEFDILELKTDYSGWFIRYHVILDAVTRTFPEMTWVFNRIFEGPSVLCVNLAAKEEESILVLFVSGIAISFNLNNKTSEEICFLLPCYKIALDYEWVDAFQYIGGLFQI
ncbi:hypothetical protein L1049_012379 [Liquidambar formosana]|uniref:F-box associated beta-propeller type 1 domain-containing protein n=1 Tax=Liquidambar formosana TaxID=63359 RepID=A0AAP0N111_LIQFO